MNFYEKSLGTESVNSILFKLNLYKKTFIDWGKYNTSNAYDYEFGVETIVGYNVNYSDDFTTLIDFLFTDYVVHGKCPHCNKATAMNVYKSPLNDPKMQDKTVWSYREDAWDSDDFENLSDHYMKERILELCKNGGYFTKYFQCPMCKNIYSVSFKLIFKDDKLYMIKTGQYPSLRDFNENYTNRFSKNLKKQNLDKEYMEALTTHDEGHSVAAYVYMRRIIEKLILQKFSAKEKSISIEDFNSKHFDEKIEYLKEDLPDLLKDKKIYSLSSAGIHMLSEEECETYFPILQQAVELILLDEEMKQKEAEIRKQVSIDLEKANHTIKKKIESN